MTDWSSTQRLARSPLVLVGLVCFPLLGAAIEAERLRVLFRAQGLSLTFSNGYRVVCVGSFFNYVVPGGTGGDVMKLYLLAKENRGKGVEVAMILLVDRAVALFAMLVLILLMAIPGYSYVRGNRAVEALLVIAALVAVAILTMALLAFSTTIRASRLHRFVTTRLPLGGFFARAFDAIHALRDHKLALLRAAALSLVGHLLLAALFAAVGSVLFGGRATRAVPFLAMLGMLANALPITPGGLGVGEAACDRLFASIGLSGGAQLVLAWRVGMLPVLGIGAFLYAKGGRMRPASPGAAGEETDPGS